MDGSVLTTHGGYQTIQVETQSITNDARWKTFVLYGYGERSAENCRRCPEGRKDKGR